MVTTFGIVFTIPWKMAADLVEGLEGTAKGGVRYPIPHFLRYTPQFPASYQELQRQWEQGEKPQQ